MALGPNLSLRVSQTLVVSPQLQAAIKLLALSNLELQAEISGELERNPLLELADEDGGGADRTAEEHAEPSDAADADAAAHADDAEQPFETTGDIASLDIEMSDEGVAGADLDADYDAEYFHHDSPADSATANSGMGEDFSFDSVVAEEETLAATLERQAIGLPPADRIIASTLIASLDDAGYLTEPLAAVAMLLGTSEAEVERVLKIIQTFEPTGVGARDLAECIALQAKEADRYDPCMAALIDNLELVARGDLAQLRRLCDVDAEDLTDMLRELRGYNPKPGLRYGGARTVAVVPDVFVRRTAKGWAVELNGATLPRLIVNQEYRANVTSQVANQSDNARKDKQFIEQCASQAHWLVKALDQRANTILKVVTALVEQQEAFFTHGVQHLKPLTLRAIAEIIGMHESTVSRVTSNKYLSCARGLFELKYFFTHAIQSADGGEDASAEVVRNRLKALIDAEPPLKPLSDDKLAQMLKDDGFDVARRTIAKYREAMNIPSSFDRRRRAMVRA